MNQRLLPLAAALLLAGCASVGRDYQPPATPMAGAWADAGPEGAGVALERWWSVYHDPELDRLVARAISTNFDIRIATARLREARAAVGISEADQLPDLDASASVTRERNLFITPFGIVNAMGTFFQAGFDASWEIDVFGGTRREVEAARADLGAVEASRRDVLVSVTAEVVRAYLELCSAQQRLVIAENTLSSQQQSRDLIAAQTQAGLVDASALAQADAQLASNKTVLPLLDIARHQAAHRLSVLIAEPVPTLTETPVAGHPADRQLNAQVAGTDGGATAPLFRVTALPDPIEQISAGLPSQLLERRPDIAQAERSLAAATARYGVAVADLYPSFSLLGSFGFENTHAAGLFTASNQIWSIGPAVRWPLLGAGLSRIRASIDAADARSVQALLIYQKTVLTACAEVEDALVALSRDRARAVALDAALAAHRRALELVRDRQAHGVDNFLAVLREELALFDAEDQFQLGRKAVAEDLVVLAKALGGGWQDVAVPAPSTAAAKVP
jgi:outer membrane protein TolC